MYRKPSNQFTINDFKLPFGGVLSADNRCVQMAAMIFWDAIEKKYAALFIGIVGNVAKTARMPLGVLIIKAKCTLFDEETMEQIKENLYLQYFLGFKEFQIESPFDLSLMVHFRKRCDLALTQEINEMICLAGKEEKRSPELSDRN